MNWPRGVPLPSATVREDVPFVMRWNGVAPSPTATARSACSIPPRSSPAGTASRLPGMEAAEPEVRARGPGQAGGHRMRLALTHVVGGRVRSSRPSWPSGSPEASRDALPSPSRGSAEPLGVGAESHPRIAIVVEAPPDGLVEQLELILEGRPAFGRRQLKEVEQGSP
jgi:hypothetical protein